MAPFVPAHFLVSPRALQLSFWERATLFLPTSFLSSGTVPFLALGAAHSHAFALAGKLQLFFSLSLCQPGRSPHPIQTFYFLLTIHLNTILSIIRTLQRQIQPHPPAHLRNTKNTLFFSALVSGILFTIFMTPSGANN